MGRVVTLPARGRPAAPHPSTAKFDTALGWLMRLRVYQGMGWAFTDALTQANTDFGWRQS